MLDGYSNRMLTAPRYVREGNRLILDSVALVPAPRPEGPQGRPPARSDGAEGRVSEDSQGADAPPAPEAEK